MDMGISSSLRSVFFTDAQHGWACGEGNLILIAKEGTGGEIEWTVSSIPGEPASLTWHDIKFIDQTTGWVVGEGGNVYKTIDGGMTWVPETTGVTHDLNAIHMHDQATGWIAGEGGTILVYTP